MKCFAKNPSFIRAKIMLAVVALGVPAFDARAVEPGLPPPSKLSPLGNLPLYVEANRG